MKVAPRAAGRQTGQCRMEHTRVCVSARVPSLTCEVTLTQSCAQECVRTCRTAAFFLIDQVRARGRETEGGREEGLGEGGWLVDQQQAQVS